MIAVVLMLLISVVYIWGRILNICVELFSGTLSNLFPIYAKFRGTNVGFGNDMGTFSNLPRTVEYELDEEETKEKKRRVISTTKVLPKTDRW